MLLSICSEEASTESTYVSHSKLMAELAIANLPLPHSCSQTPITIGWMATPLVVEHPVEAEVPSPLTARG